MSFMVVRTPGDVQVIAGSSDDTELRAASSNNAGTPATNASFRQSTNEAEMAHTLVMRQETDLSDDHVNPDTCDLTMKSLVSNYLETWWAKARWIPDTFDWDNAEERPQRLALRALQTRVYQAIQREADNWVPQECVPLPWPGAGNDAGSPATFAMHTPSNTTGG